MWHALSKHVTHKEKMTIRVPIPVIQIFFHTDFLKKVFRIIGIYFYQAPQACGIFMLFKIVDQSSITLNRCDWLQAKP